MSLRELLEPDCQGQNSLMRLGNQIRHDNAFKDEGFGSSTSFVNRPQQFGSDQLVQEFLGQIAPPQSFRMDALLQEMREIDAQSYHNQMVQRAPLVIEEVNSGFDWANEFSSGNVPYQSNVDFGAIDGKKLNEFWDQNAQNVDPGVFQSLNDKPWEGEFLDISGPLQQMNIAGSVPEQLAGQSFMHGDSDQFKYSEFMKFMQNVDGSQIGIENSQVLGATANDWVSDFNSLKTGKAEETDDYNNQFWNRLQDEWKNISSETEQQHPWTSEFNEYHDPYTEYTFDEENPMTDLENAFEKGKFFLSQGDIPSAVLCFESAVKQDPNNAEIWELLGTSQAENEKDPNAIAAMKRSLELNPNNPNVMMSLAVSFTNESLQIQASDMLVNWLKCNDKYRHLIPSSMMSSNESTTSTIARGPDLKEVQEIFLKAVQQRHPDIDPDIQEALGVLFNLSSEYDKAVDCFNAALHVRSDNAKTWNRLGASLANGNRSTEAVTAYQRALDIQPGFIRARYNVGIICINLKAYNEAAEHFLQALNMQADSLTRSGLHQTKPSNQMSDTIWSTLRMAISLMGRMDLQSAVDDRNLTALNEAFNLNVTHRHIPMSFSS